MTDTNNAAIDLEKLLASAQLPALPQSAIRLLELSQDPTNGPAEFALPIESDPGLAGQVLRFVNSSYFGFSREISSVKLAITLVGIRTIKNFALWSAVFSLMPNPKCGSLELKSLWQDSLRRALFARGMGKLLGVKEVEELFSAALLQDMAVPLLAKEAAEVYQRLLEARDGGKRRLSWLENQVFGWTHAEAAGIMARNWNLPDAFVVLIENHLDAERWSESPDVDSGNLAVALSGLLPTIADAAWSERDKFQELYDKVTSPGAPSVVDFLGQIDEEFAAFAPMLKLATPSKSMVDSHNEMAATSAD